jgi:diguanylate cyclase (GGDEF)-like protein
MMLAAGQPLTSLDMPTLSFVSVVVVAVLGLLLVMTWLQQRKVRALAWWGAAYLIGASSMALWTAPGQLIRLPAEVPAAMIFIACGMIWNGMRLFHGRQLMPIAASTGAIVWLVLCQLPAVTEGSNARIVLGAVIVSIYTFFIAFELWRERRKSLYSRSAAIVVPFLHAAVFLMPLAMRVFVPGIFMADWLMVFALDTLIYLVGTAFIVLLMVKDYDVSVYRDAANIDPLTGLLNRRAFLENAFALCERQGRKSRPLTLMMFDLDHFKSVNDRFGHAAGDDVLRVFAQVARKSTRATDIIGRLGGEEFTAVVPESMEISIRIAERIRKSFEAAGVEIAGQAIGATVSIGIATSQEPVMNIEAMLARADAALYRAKREGRNRLRGADGEHVSEAAQPISAARAGRTAKVRQVARRKRASPRRRPIGRSLGRKGETSRLLYPH